MRFLLCGINAKYIHSNLAIFSLKAYADRKKIPGAEIILKEYTINNYVEDIIKSSRSSLDGFSRLYTIIRYVDK